MDIEAILQRAPLAGQPLSLVVRAAEGGTEEAIIDQARALLANRNPLDEILIMPGSRGHASHLAGARAIRSRPGRTMLGCALEACRWPIVVLWSPTVSLAPDQLRAVVRLLDDCDLVAGRRARAWRWWSWWGEWLAQWFFGVPLADPLCPFKVIRKAAVSELTLQLEGELADFELVAKMTFLTSLMDECDVPALDRPRPLLALLAKSPGQIAKLYFFPRFWRFDRSAQSRLASLIEPPAAPPAGPTHPTAPATGTRRAPGLGWGPSYPRSSLRSGPPRR